MKIIVNDKNKEKINDAIKKAEGKARERTITANDIFWMVKNIEENLGIPKSKMLGVVATVDYHAQKFPNAYKYPPYSTHVVLEKVSTGWAVVDIRRNITRRNKRFVIELTNEAKEELIYKHSSFN